MVTGVSGSFIVYKDDVSTYVRIYDEADFGLIDVKTLNEVCHDAARDYCFSDCSDEEVVAVFVNGRELEYAGWKPGMHYVFRDAETKETVWEGRFPEWDH